MTPSHQHQHFTRILPIMSPFLLCLFHLISVPVTAFLPPSPFPNRLSYLRSTPTTPSLPENTKTLLHFPSKEDHSLPPVYKDHGYTIYTNDNDVLTLSDYSPSSSSSASSDSVDCLDSTIPKTFTSIHFSPEYHLDLTEDVLETLSNIVEEGGSVSICTVTVTDTDTDNGENENNSVDSSSRANTLPQPDKLREIIRFQPFTLSSLQSTAQTTTLTLTKTPYNTLRRPMFLRSNVAHGFGRGGSKLGFPTANYQRGEFSEFLDGVDTGVYFGWACVERSQGGVFVGKDGGGDGDGDGDGDGERGDGVKNTQVMAVVNVGYCPTFEDEDGGSPKEKIIEAHLIFSHPQPPAEFYGSTMRLLLLGHLRPEVKFGSLQELKDQIGRDRENAIRALQEGEFGVWKGHSFFTEVCRRWGEKGGEGNVVGEEYGMPYAEKREFIEAVRETPLGRFL
mgnify:CR=1 FL=1